MTEHHIPMEKIQRIIARRRRFLFENCFTDEVNACCANSKQFAPSIIYPNLETKRKKCATKEKGKNLLESAANAIAFSQPNPTEQKKKTRKDKQNPKLNVGSSFLLLLLSISTILIASIKNRCSAIKRCLLL